MKRAHCDNCDALLAPDAGTRRIANFRLKNGVEGAVEIIVIQPMTERRLELCDACRDMFIASVTPVPA